MDMKFSEYKRVLRNLFFQLSTVILVLIPGIISFIVIWIWLYTGIIPPRMDYLMSGIVCFIWSISSMIIIWRKEAPLFITLKGKPAIIFGVIGALFFLLGALHFILKYWGMP